MIRWAVVTVVALLLGATTAFSFQDSVDISAGLDLNVEGNGPAAVGEIDSCAAPEVGSTFDIDVFVEGVPTEGVSGYGFNLNFDPAVISITAVDPTVMLPEGPQYSVVDADYDQPDPQELPSTSGNLRVDHARLAGEPPSGSGVLTRLTVEVVGEGQTELVLDSQLEGVPAPVALYGTGFYYNIAELTNAVIVAGGSCADAPVPTPFDPDDNLAETPGPTGNGGGETPDGTDNGETDGPDGSPTEPPTGETTLAVDAVPTGNEATSPDEINDCAGADEGDNFIVDVIIREVTDLLAFDIAVSFDGDVLTVVDRDVEMFLEASEGSVIVDGSAETPNDNGLYQVQAVDTADPLSPDSGSGVLFRLTFEATAEGVSPITIEPVDLDGNGEPDRGVFLRDVNADVIGDEDNDTLFDGPVAGAEIMVGDDCPDGSRVVLDADGGPTTAPGGDDDDGDSSAWIFIVIAIAAAVVVLGGGGYWWFVRRRQTPV